MENENVETVEVPGQPESETKGFKDEDPIKPKAEPSKYIRRADWGARPPKWIDVLQTPVSKVVLTWTETDPCTTEEECKQRVREIQVAHMKDDKCPDIRHNFLVGGDGALYEGRGYTRLGPDYPKNEKTHNELFGKSIEIAFIQRHAPFQVNSTEPVKACLGIGVDDQYVKESPDFVYMVDGKPMSVDPNDQLNDIKLDYDY